MHHSALEFGDPHSFSIVGSFHSSGKCANFSKCAEKKCVFSAKNSGVCGLPDNGLNTFDTDELSEGRHHEKIWMFKFSINSFTK